MRTSFPRFPGCFEMVWRAVWIPSAAPRQPPASRVETIVKALSLRLDPFPFAIMSIDLNTIYSKKYSLSSLPDHLPLALRHLSTKRFKKDQVLATVYIEFQLGFLIGRAASDLSHPNTLYPAFASVTVWHP